MGRTRIKFCGVMRPSDATAAARAGADAVGLVMYPRARRCVPMETAERIVRALPPFITPVALFVDQDVDEIIQVASALRIRHVQLHGRETPEMVGELRAFTVLKSVRVTGETLVTELDRWREAGQSFDLAHLHALVLETAAAAPGGTGIENDWKTIAAVQAAGGFNGLPPIIAAGGLHPENVGEVVRRIRPWAVDVSSGIEVTFGEKSIERMQQFTENVRLADR